MTARRLLAALLAAATATIGLAAQPAAAAAPAATVVVAPDDAGMVRSGQSLGVTVTVTNTGPDRLAAGRIAISLDQAPLASTAALLSSIATPSGVLLGDLTRATAKVPALDAGATATVRAKIAKEDLTTILTSASGARLLYARYRSGAVQTVAESSVVKIAADSGASVGFGTVIPILAPAGTTGVVQPTDQQQLAGPDGAWSNALRAALADPTATIALDPEVLASIRLAGASAPPEAAGFLDQLGQLPNQFVELPYADGDVTLEAAAGEKSALRTSSFAGVTLAPVADGGPSPAPTATPTSTSASVLTAWNWSDQSVAWPVPHSTTATGLAALAAAKDTVLLGSDDVQDVAARRSAGPLARIGTTRVLVSDTTVSALLEKATTKGPTGDAALATLVGALATAAVTGETSAVLGTVGRSGGTAGLDRVLSLLNRQSWIRGRSLSDLSTAQSSPKVTLRAGSLLSSRTSTAKALIAREHDVQDLGKAIVSGADTVIAPQRLALLAMLSTAWRGDDTGWRTSAATVEKGFDRVATSVHLADQSDPNFVGNDGHLPIYVVNELPTPVRVVVHGGVSNNRVQFTGTASTTVTVPAGGQQKGMLPFRSITNGKTDLTLRLTTTGGVAIGSEVVQPATVRAGFDTIVAVVLLTALGLLLALGVYRNVNRRRHPRTAVA